MGIAETVVSPMPAGAGRMMDFSWPDPYNVTLQSVIRMRNGSTLDNTTPPNTGIQGGTVTTIAVVNGVDCLQSASTGAAAGNKWTFNGPGALHPRTKNGYLPPTLADDFGFYRVIVVMASPGTPAANRDFGMQIAAAASGCIYRDGASGFGFNINVAAGLPILEFVVRGPNGLIHNTGGNLATVDTTKFHAYEIRIQSATATSEATMTPLVDGVPVTGLAATTLSWAAGTDLPSSAVNGASIGFNLVHVSDANAAVNLVSPFHGGVRIQIAPSVNYIF